jgi:mevalonate kinase
VTIVSSASGEIFFFGEHSVVYGKLALATAVGKRITTVADPADDIVVESRFGKLKAEIRGKKLINVKSPKALEPFIKTTEQVFKKFGHTAGFHMVENADIPSGSGMASSAASSAAFLGALLKILGEKLTEREMVELVYQSELNIQGRASRTGPSCAVMGGVLQIKGANISRVKGVKPVPIVIGYTGKPSLTSVTTAHVKKLLNKNPKEIKRIFNQIEEIAKKGKKALVKGDREKIGELMNENQELLQRLGVSSRELDNIINAVRDIALGSKLTGGGGGGCMIALCNEEDVDEIAKLIIENGGEPIITEIAAEGLKVEQR